MEILIFLLGVWVGVALTVLVMLFLQGARGQVDASHEAHENKDDNSDRMAG